MALHCVTLVVVCVKAGWRWGRHEAGVAGAPGDETGSFGSGRVEEALKAASGQRSGLAEDSAGVTRITRLVSAKVDSWEPVTKKLF